MTGGRGGYFAECSLRMTEAVLKPQCGAKAEGSSSSVLTCGTAAVCAPDALKLSGGRRAGRMTHCILAETLRQRGNGVVTNTLIRIFGDDQHMGDWPLGVISNVLGLAERHPIPRHPAASAEA